MVLPSLENIYLRLEIIIIIIITVIITVIALFDF